MWAKHKHNQGFTIVELLIVIVVIGILAAITTVAYNGVQVRARDTTRAADIAAIRKALDIYRADNDRYPVHTGIGSNAPSGFVGRYGASYSYSIATNTSWLNNLISSGVITKSPVDPLNDNNHYYIYWASGPTGYGACTEPFYVLIAYGLENGNNIADSRSLSCTMPDGSFGSSWQSNSTQAVFSNTRTP